MSLRSVLELDARLSNRMRVAEKPGALRAMAAFFAHSGDSWFWGAALILLWVFSNSAWRKWEVVEFVGISLLAALVMLLGAPPVLWDVGFQLSAAATLGLVLYAEPFTLSFQRLVERFTTPSRARTWAASPGSW